VLGNVGVTLERYMTLLSVRQRLTAANIANADTPGYRAKDLDFNRELQSAMPAEGAKPVEVRGLTVKNDGNNVSVDREARQLAENALRFNVAANLLRSRLNLIRMAIRENRNV
jgi:flagellar basal-body rod protein FlgB